jgi:hypothetical protein
MNFQHLVEQILQEDVVAGGDSSSFGPNVGDTATTFSGDNYAPGDARNAFGVYSGVLTRSGMKKKKKKSKKKQSKKKK